MDDFLTRLDKRLAEAMAPQTLQTKADQEWIKLMRLQAKNERAKVRKRIEGSIEKAPVEESYMTQVEGRLNEALGEI